MQIEPGLFKILNGTLVRYGESEKAVKEKGKDHLIIPFDQVHLLIRAARASYSSFESIKIELIDKIDASRDEEELNEIVTNYIDFGNMCMFVNNFYKNTAEEIESYKPIGASVTGYNPDMD